MLSSIKSIKVRDYMTRQLITLKPDTDLFAAINRLLENRISGAPVVDAQGRLIGMLSEGDCLRSILSGAYYDSIGGIVADCMTSNTDSVSPETDIIEVSQLFLQGRRGRIPVVENGRLIGQISRHDVLRAVKEFAQHDPGRQARA